MFVSHHHDRDHWTASDSYQRLKEPQNLPGDTPGGSRPKRLQPAGVRLLSLLPEQPFGENDLDDFLRGFRTGPVALQLNRERDPTGQLCARPA
jgi:hypothetical protein